MISTPNSIETLPLSGAAAPNHWEGEAWSHYHAVWLQHRRLDSPLLWICEGDNNPAAWFAWVISIGDTGCHFESWSFGLAHDFLKGSYLDCEERGDAHIILDSSLFLMPKPIISHWIAENHWKDIYGNEVNKSFCDSAFCRQVAFGRGATPSMDGDQNAFHFMQDTRMVAQALRHTQEWLPLISTLLRIRQIPKTLLAYVNTWNGNCAQCKAAKRCLGMVLVSHLRTTHLGREHHIYIIYIYSFHMIVCMPCMLLLGLKTPQVSAVKLCIHLWHMRLFHCGGLNFSARPINRPFRCMAHRPPSGSRLFKSKQRAKRSPHRLKVWHLSDCAAVPFESCPLDSSN